MLDVRTIRQDPEAVRANCTLRNVAANVDRVLELDREKIAKTTELQEIQRQQNEVAKRTKQAGKDKAARDACIEEGRRLKEQAQKVQDSLDCVEGELEAELARLPNLTHPDAPRTEEDAVVRTWGTPPTFDFEPLDHVALCDKHDLADFEAAAKTTGASFYFLKNEGALLELALIEYALKTIIKEGFTPVLTPDLARNEILQGTGYMPRGPETQIYSVENSDLSLIATAEITLGGMYAGDILDAEKLPILLGGVSHCFRTEAGAAGRATRGLFRVHQFTKVEMFAFTRPGESDAMHQRLLGIEEKIFQGLEIPYRVLDIRGGDLGGPAYRKYDIEAWMPGRGEGGEYAEVTSTSNCTDFQARRLKIRFKEAGAKGTQFVHMLNGTAIAVGRAIIAILENHQQADGSVRIPAPLVPYMGKETIGG